MKESIQDKIKTKIGLIIQMEELFGKEYNDIKPIKESVINLLKEKYKDERMV